MRKILVCFILLFLANCSGDISKYSAVDANASAKTKMRACMVREATAKFQAGTLFLQGISDTSDELVSICLRKLALESVGIGEESQSTAQNIIQNLRNFGSVN